MIQAPSFMEDTDTSELVSEDTLTQAKKLAKQYFDAETRVEDLSDKLEEAKRELNELKLKKVPELFGTIQIDRIGLPDDDCDVRIAPFVKANISQQWEPEKIKEGFRVLDEELDGGDLIRTTLVYVFQKEEHEDAKELQEFIRNNFPKANSLVSEIKMEVPWGTLTSFLKGYIEDESTDPLTDAQKEALGATVGMAAKIVKRKKK